MRGSLMKRYLVRVKESNKEKHKGEKEEKKDRT
jgi:hypothetical protein